MLECASNPCQNAGTCIDQESAFLCVCQLGFTGELCGNNFERYLTVLLCVWWKSLDQLAWGLIIECEWWKFESIWIHN